MIDGPEHTPAKDAPQPPTVERRALSGAAKIAIRHITDRATREIDEVVNAAGADQGLDPRQGWGFDPQSQSWARAV